MMRADYPTPEQLPALRRLWVEAFEDDDAFLDGFYNTGFSSDRCRCICIDGQVAAALYWFDCRCRGAAMAYIYAVATAKAFRGQGLCRALMADTHRHLQNLGYAGCILVPGEPELFSMYETMGYTPFSGMDAITCEAGEGVFLQEVSPEEYGRLRQTYLPRDGVLQDGIAFLATYAALCAGNDFIAACIDCGSTLFAAELLGNTDAAPGIVAALGKAQGTFRVPGTGKFAMYHPLTDTPAPGWFGLAFD
jgi:predicted N-acetyltransferase YhbS